MEALQVQPRFRNSLQECSINYLDKGKTTVYTPSHERKSTCVLLDQLTLALWMKFLDEMQK